MSRLFPGSQATTDSRGIGFRWVVTTVTMVVAAVSLLLFAPTTVIAIPFNLLVTLFLVLGGAIVLPLGLVRRGDGVSGSPAQGHGANEVSGPPPLVAGADEFTDPPTWAEGAGKVPGPWTKKRAVTPQTDLKLNSETGLISHGNMRHVLFRIGTIQEILIAADPDRVEKRDTATLLFETGKRMGDGFGRQFLAHLHEFELAVHQPNLDDLIEKWCDFDVSGGWGKWHPTRLDDAFKGRIEIKYNYLTAQADPPVLEGRSLCKLLEGYITGVLQLLARAAIPGRNWTAEVHELSPCGIVSNGKKPCEFSIQLHADS